MDVFASLGCGVRFDRKRHAEQMELFRPKKRSAGGESGALALTSNVDFFAQQVVVGKDVQGKPSSSKTSTTVDDRGVMDDHVIENDHVIVDDHGEESAADFANQEELGIFRKQHRIRVYGSDVAAPFKTFEHLQRSTYAVENYLVKNMRAVGYTQPTPIQMQAVPILLSGRDLIACAPTGSGKTLAFILPLLHKLSSTAATTTCNGALRAVVIAPTRELAQQIYREFSRLVGTRLKVSLLSKANLKNRDKKYDILVSTPLRLVTALTQEFIDLSSVAHIVVDEADKLFEMGFIEQLDTIIAACTSVSVQKALFSATIGAEVETLAKTVMKEPVRVVIGQKNAATDLIKQQLLYVGQEEGKLIAIRQLVQQGIKPPVLIFVDSVDRAKSLFHELIYDGINVDVIHSERTQAQRENVIKNFRLGKIWVLIATDLLGRGVDFKGVNMVINYDFPRSVASYIHRIGRTGRAGREGEAITYFTKEDGVNLRGIANVMKESGCDVPAWMLKLPKPKEVKQAERNKRARAAGNEAAAKQAKAAAATKNESIGQ